MTRDETLIIAEELISRKADILEIADAIFKAWSDGYATGDMDGYANGYTDGFTDAGRVGA